MKNQFFTDKYFSHGNKISSITYIIICCKILNKIFAGVSFSYSNWNIILFFCRVNSG